MLKRTDRQETILFDGLNRPVHPSHKGIKSALLDTEMVEISRRDISISYYHARENHIDEINVYDSRERNNPQVSYDVEDVDRAVYHFMRVVNGMRIN